MNKSSEYYEKSACEFIDEIKRDDNAQMFEIRLQSAMLFATLCQAAAICEQTEVFKQVVRNGNLQVDSGVVTSC